MSLITTAQLKERLPEYKGTDEDAEHTKLIGRANALMAAWCGFPVADSGVAPSLVSATYTRYLDGPRYTDPHALFVGLRPLISITSVHQDLQWDYGSSTEVTEGTDFDADLAAGVLWMRPDTTAGAWLRSRRVVKAVVVAGFATPLNDAHPLVELCAEVVRHIVNRPRVAGVTSATGAGITVQNNDLAKLVPMAVLDALSPYQLGGALIG